jgi:hypothetical protein
LFNGTKWNSVPIGIQWAPRSTSHRWLGIWQKDGTWKRLAERILGVADNLGLVDLRVGSVDGMFVPGKGGSDDVAYGFKGKGATLHHMCDNNGRTIALETTAANVDERKVLEALLDRFEIQNGKPGRPKKRMKVLQGDKGYQDKNLQERLKKRGISTEFSRKETTGKKARSTPWKAGGSIQNREKSRLAPKEIPEARRKMGASSQVLGRFCTFGDNLFMGTNHSPNFVWKWITYN